MKKPLYTILIALIILLGCDKEKGVITLDDKTPLVKADSSYNIIKEEDVIYVMVLVITNQALFLFQYHLN